MGEQVMNGWRGLLPFFAFTLLFALHPSLFTLLER
jgi:ABC-type uncharacterized transport system permease subunit